MLDLRARARFRRNRAAVVGAAIVVFLVLFAVVGPSLAGQDPYVSDFARGVSPEMTPIGPSRAHWLGTDRIFRDELARLAAGARLSLVIGIAATVISSLVGALVGLFAGYYEDTDGVRIPWPFLTAVAVSIALVIGGRPGAALVALLVGAALWLVGMVSSAEVLRHGLQLNLDTALMRFVDVGLSFPFLLLVMAVGSALDRISVVGIFATLGLTSWLGIARIVRAKTMQIKKHDYVVAARALGQSTVGILVRHVVPNVTGPLVVIGTLSVAQMIVAESVLSYLGVGVAPPTATWGHMLFEGQDFYRASPWLLACPALAILLAVFGFNLLGEGLRDALDPRED